MIDLYNDDCLEIMKSIPSQSVDMVLTDPPYEVETSGAGLYRRKERPYLGQINPISNGFDEQILDEICRIMKKINLYIFCSQKQILPLLKYFVDGKKCNYNIISWHKTNPVPACGNKYLTDTEFVLFFREKGVKIGGSYDTKRTYYVTPLNTADKKLYQHPTVKPTDILQNLIMNSTNENDVVLDCFMGSGSAMIACLNTNRKGIGIEIDEKYFSIAKNRIDEHQRAIA